MMTVKCLMVAILFAATMVAVAAAANEIKPKSAKKMMMATTATTKNTMKSSSTMIFQSFLGKVPSDEEVNTSYAIQKLDARGVRRHLMMMMGSRSSFGTDLAVVESPPAPVFILQSEDDDNLFSVLEGELVPSFVERLQAYQTTNPDDTQPICAGQVCKASLNALIEPETEANGCLNAVISVSVVLGSDDFRLVR